jgi:ATP-dependent helicase/nuclease subunit A
MSERQIPPDVQKVQAEASDPAVSAFVAANAGSGKTHVLAQRVIRLLLQDFDPARILCITFTKTAAANMANRVFDVLRQWIALNDEALAAAMHGIGVRDTSAPQIARARRLFALALETPGGLKVQTIHAFCTSLLHLFPFEANVAAHFEVMDEAAVAQLLDEITLKVLLEAAKTPDSPLGRALARRLEGTDAAPPGLSELARKVELLEAEVDDLSRSMRSLEDENKFLQRLLTEQPPRATLPPPPAP